MLRRLVFLLALSFTPLFASSESAPRPAVPPITGVVADPSGAIVPGAVIQLVDDGGAIAGSVPSSGDGTFELVPPHAGNYTLIISEAGFDTVKTPVVVLAPAVSAAAVAGKINAAPLKIVLPIAALSTNVHVSADSDTDLTAGDDNHDSSVLTSSDLKALPIFDNDLAGAMSAFLDDSAAATGGSGLIVDGVESNRATMSASAIQEVRINQDPYSAQYNRPGRGQMEIISKSAADKYHGELNFIFRDSAMNAQNALAPTKPNEQRRVYEGHATGPVFFAPKSSFLASFDRSEEDTNSLIVANLAPTQQNPTGRFTQNVPAPNRDTEFSTRFAHQFSDRHSAYAEYSYQNWNGKNQGVGGQSLAPMGTNGQYREDDLKFHVDSVLSPVLMNQFSLVGERSMNRNDNVANAQRISVAGYFTTGSAQANSHSTEYNARLYDSMSYTHGRHFIKFGIGLPHMNRRAFDDHTNVLGSYTFSPTMAADGVTVLHTALENYENNKPSAYSQNYGDDHFVYHQQEVGAFVQDQIKLTARLSITPGLRYDWQNFFAQKRLGFSPRMSFGYVLDQESKLVLRGGGGIYYDRTGSGSLLDLVRFEGLQPRRRSVTLKFNPTTEPAGGCVPVSQCADVYSAPVNRTEFDPHARMPYQIHYGLSIERQLGEKATGTISVYSMRDIGAFRSIDVNAPTPQSGYTQRPDQRYARIRLMQPEGFVTGSGFDVNYRGRFNKYFTGFGRYTWSHYGSNTDGPGFYPENQYNPQAEWANSRYDRRHRLSLYAMLNPDKLLNLSAGIWANAGTPWTVSTGTDPYGDNLFNGRPAGVARNSRNLPANVNLDLRWGHDFAITRDKADEAPHLGFSVSSFNALNHVNTWWVNTVATSPGFGQMTAAGNPRRLQLAMRYQF